MAEEIIVFRGPNGERKSYSTVTGRAAINQLVGSGVPIVDRFPAPTGGGKATETPAEAGLGALDRSPQVQRQRRSFNAAVLPMLGAGAATMLVPEAMPLAWAARTGMAALGGGATDPLAQMVRGEKPTFGHAMTTARETGVAQLGGEGLSALARLGANGLAGRTMAGAPKRVFRQEIANESRATGDRLSPGDASLGQKMLSEGVAPGRAPWEKSAGSEVMNQRLDQATKARDAILRRPNIASVRYNSHSFIGPHVRTLRMELARLGKPEVTAWLERRIADFHDGFTLNGRPKRFSPAQTNDELLSTWDDAAKPLHEEAQGLRAPLDPGSRLEARFMEAVANDARARLRSLTPAPNGGIGEFEKANQDIYRMMPIRDALTDLEIPRLHTDPALMSATTGLGALTGVMGGGAGIAEGASAGALLGHAMAQPPISGRAALLLNQPWLQEGLRRAPLAGDAAIRTMMENQRNKRRPAK